MWWLLITHRWIFFPWNYPLLKLCPWITLHSMPGQDWGWRASFSEHLYWAIPTPELFSRSAKAFVAGALWFNCSLCPIQFPSQESILRPFLNLFPECQSQLGACFLEISVYNQEVILGRGGLMEEAYQGLAKNEIFEMKNVKDIMEITHLGIWERDIVLGWSESFLYHLRCTAQADCMRN